MRGTYKTLRKTAVFIAGMAVIIAGIILLVIPGPGLLTVAAGLLILSTEFEWAERHLNNVKKKIQETYEKSKQRRKGSKGGKNKQL